MLRPPPGRLAAPLLVLVTFTLLTLGGCAAPRPEAAATAPPPAVGAYGVIVAMRPPPTRQAPMGQALGGPDIRHTILAAIGAPAASERADAGIQEFIIRADDGRTLSVVQSNDAQLRPGERVRLAPGMQSGGADRVVRASL